MYKKKKGITLLELIFALAISSIVLGSFYMFFFSNNRSLAQTQYKSDLQGEGEMIIKRLTKNLMLASKITEITDKYNNDKKDDTSCNISQVKITVQSGEISEEAIYKVNNNNVFETFQGHNDVPIGENVQSITLETLDNRAFKDCRGIKVTINLSKKYGNKDIDYQLNSNIVFRNSKKT